MEKYPDYETYRALYARYYKGRDVAELLRLLEPLQGRRVLDLCGGDGRLSLAALAAGASTAELVDASADMVSPEVRSASHASVRVGPVHATLIGARARGDSYDRVVCRQAVNYWLNNMTVGLISRVMRTGGIFAFNTFNQKPPEKPRVLEYELDHSMFTEVSWCIGDTVHHLQVRQGMEPHYTSFAWLPPELLRKMLEPYFAVIEERHAKTSLYRCEKK